MPRRELLLESCEDRILCSVTVPYDGTADHGSDLPTTTSDAPQSSAQGGVTEADQATAASETPTPAGRQEIVFIDTGVENYQELVKDLEQQRAAGRPVEVVLLDANRDGLTQISAALAGRSDIDAVHFIGHGSESGLQLGGTWLDATTFAQRREEIATWGRALSGSADLLFYGCDLAASGEGRQLLEALAQNTGADVEASIDPTGQALLGGDWDLEYGVGSIETAVAISSAGQQGWVGLLDATPAGAETRVNTTTTNTQVTVQNTPGATAMDANGNYVIVWTSTAQDGGLDGVYAQRYNAAGVAQGAEFRVNTTTANAQDSATVAMDANGNFVVTWASNLQDGSGYGVYAQRYNAAGVAQGGEFKVNTFTAANQWMPTAAMDAAGNFIITWSSNNQDGDSWGVYAQRYNAAGVAQGGEFRVNTTTTNAQEESSVAMNAAGDFVVAWSSLNTDGSSWGIYAQRYNAAGVAQGGEFQVNTFTNADQRYPSVAINTAGNFVITWSGRSNQDGGSPLGNGWGVFAQRYNAAGVAQGAEFRVNTTTGDDQMFARAAMDTNGNFVIVWQSYGQDAANTWGVYGQHYNAAGVAQGAEFRVNTTTAADQQYASVAMAPGGSFVVAWSGNGTGDAAGIFAQRFTTASPNQAPVLDSSKSPALTAINEDAGAPSGAVGTLVSQLVDFATPAGQVDNVTDADAGALLGIAITAADTTNGTWFYSTDGGANWNALGAVSAASARLLAADASTRLYFQPNANYNGTLANAITFRAWDQTSGGNGGTTAIFVNSNTVLDNLSSQSYSNNNGTQSWSTNWIETDGGGGGATGGFIKVTASPAQLQITADTTGNNIYREVDLSGATSATLSYLFDASSFGQSTALQIQVSGNGGSSYTTLKTYASGASSGTESFDITPYISANTRIRFSVSSGNNKFNVFTADNIQIAYSALGGGASAFSLVSDTASLVVNPVNDAPRIDDLITTLQEGSANGTAVASLNEAFTNADFDVEGQALTYSITGGNTGATFAINPSTGAITVSNNALLDFNTHPAFTLTVQASDGTLSDTATVTVNLIAAPLGGGTGSFAITQNNNLYSVNFDTGKATLLFADTALATNGINSLGFDSVNGIYYYADSGNGSTAIYGWDARAGGARFVVTADVRTFGVTLGTAGMGASGGDFNGGSYYFSTEGGGVGSADQLFKVNFDPLSNGRTIQSITLISNSAIPGANEFGDFVVDAAAGKFYSFNSGTGVAEYNMVLGATPSLTFVQTDANAAVRQGAMSRFNVMYAVDGNFGTYNPAGAGTFGATKNITTNGTTLLGSAFDGSSYVPAEASIGDTVFFDLNANAVQDGTEGGVAGLTVTIYYDLNGDGVINGADSALTSTTTDVNGKYSFAHVLPDNYVIKVTDPTNILNGGASTTGGATQAASITLVGQSITNKDFGFQDNRPALAVANVTATEGTDNFAVFNLTLSRVPLSPITVNLALTDVSALGGGADYGASDATNLQVFVGGTWVNATSATFAAGTTSVLVRTPISNDTLDESAETFTLTATTTTAATTNASAAGTGTIVDNDPTPSLTIDDVTVNEGAGTMTFTVNLSTASGLPVTVNYGSANVTATAGADYTATSGTLTFNPGTVSQTITVPILNDPVFEGSETFNMALSGAVNATIADGLGVATILDNGAGAGGVDNDTPTLNVSSPTVTEGTNPQAVFTVSLSNASATPTVFNLALANGSATGGGTDFGATIEISTDGGTNWTPASSATIAAGSLSVLVRTPIIDDTLDENAETFTLTATRTSGATTNANAVGTATINDNDATPALSINDVTVNEAAGTVTFTVTLSAASGLPVSVNYATSSGTAVSGADFAAASGTLNFAAGVTSQTFTVSILNDATFETSETFNVTLSVPTNATISDGLGLGTITDDGSGPGGTDNDTPTVSVTSPTVTEGTNPHAIFTLSLSNASTAATVFDLTLANGSALGGGTDFGAALEVSTDGGTNWTAATSATIAAGATSVLVRTPINNDTLDENAETFTLTATRTSGATTNASVVGTGTINDNDAPPSLAINDMTVNEAAGTATFTVTLSTASGLPVGVNYATSSGTATSGADFSAASGSLNFAAGETSKTFTVSILNDTTFENSESFNATLSGATNATIADAAGVGTILDNGGGLGGLDNDTPALSVSSPTVSEGTDNFAVFTISLSNPSTTAMVLDLALANVTATGGGTDYGAAGATNLQVSTDGGANWVNATSATIAPGATSVLVRTPITNDTLDENAEVFTLTATRTAGLTTNASVAGTATINDNDAPPSLTIGDITVNEGAGTATFTVTLSTASGLPVSVNYATSSGTATSGADFTATSGTLNFAAGETSKTFTVSILNDTIFEDSETFSVTLSSATNATIADPTGFGAILDNGTGPGGVDNDTPTVSVSSPTVTEGTNTHAVFTLSLSNASTTATVFSLALLDGSATGGGTDFGPALEVSTDGGTNWSASPTATIAAGSLSVLVRTPINNDSLSENTETFTLSATRTAGTTTNATASGLATINDNDPAAALSINDVTVNEGAGTVTFTVTLSAASGLPVTVNYATGSGTATSGADFTATSGTLTFAPGVISQTVTVSIVNDTTFENSETFNVTLSAPTNALIADGLGLGTITDDGTGAGGTDDDTPTVSIDNPLVAEGTHSHAVFTITLSNASTTAVAFNLTLADGTATGGGTDFGAGLEVSTDGGANWTPSTTASIAAGNLSVLVRTPINNDLLDEVAETFTLTASRTSGATTNPSVIGTATITDNDPPPSLSIDDLSINEGAGTATFTVTLNTPSGLPVTVNYATSNGTATAGADYSSATGTLSFAPGVTSQTITVAILNDAIFENSETFNVLLSTPTNATIADNVGVGTIHDDGTGVGGTNNDTPNLTVSSITATEGADLYAVFTVSLSNPSTTAVTVSLALANGTAVGAGTDYGTSGAGNLQVSTDGGLNWVDANSATIAAGSLSVLVRTPVANDALDEAPETFTLTATRTLGTTTNAAATGTATIADNDPAPSLTIDDVTVNEGAGTATFTVTLGPVSGQTVTVNYTTSSGTATGGVDFATSTGTLTFAAGVTSQTITVPIINDAVFEGSEAFSVLLSAAVNANISDPTGAGTILDDGTGAGGTNDDTPALNVSNVTATEGIQTHAVFAVSLSNLSTTDVTVALALANGTATGGGLDFGTAGVGNLQVSTDNGGSWNDATSATIAAGTMSILVRTPITNDLLAESTEQFTLNATRTAGATTNVLATGTADLIDNDGAPVLLIDDVTVNEGAGTATFTVSLSAVSGQNISVNYTTAGGTAAANADFTTKSGTLNFTPGVLSQTVTVTILNDGVFEGSEAFNVLLSGAVNATIADATGVGTILDDGTGAGGTDNDTPALSMSDVTVAESAGYAVFTLSLSNPSTAPVSVSLALVDGTALGGGIDYSAALEVSTDGGANWNPATSATFAPGALSVLVRTSVTSDLLDEASETFTLAATRTSGATTNATAAGIATITDDDAAPALSINDVIVNEAAGTATFTVTLGAPSGQNVTVNYAAGSGTATSGVDFTGVAGGLTFAPGVTSQTITVPILNDTTFENSETYTVTLSGATNASLADAIGVGTILDNGAGPGGTDNDTPSFSVSSPTVTEGLQSNAVFTVLLSNTSTAPVDFSLVLANGTAAGGGVDFGTGGAGNLQVSTDGGANWVDATSVTIAPGSLSVLVRTPVTNDALNEVTENFTLQVTRTAGPTTNVSATGTGTINDNDALPSLVINDVTVNEGAGFVTFTVTLSGASGQTVNVNYATNAGTATAGADFATTSGTLTFAPGVTTQTVNVAILDDTVFENSEAFLVVLSAPTNATIANANGLGTILDDGTGSGGSDNDTPTLAITNLNVTEGTDGFAVFTVTLSNASTTPVDLALALADGTALGGGTDYGTGGADNLEVSTDGGVNWTDAATATFAPGATSLLVRTPIANDAIFEALEDFTLTATRTAGATTNASVIGTTTIADNDGAPTLSINNVTVNEAAGTATFTVALSGPSGVAVDVNYATAGGTATDGADFTGTSGLISFAPGETSQTFTVSILNDPTFENSESFTVVLSGAVNAIIADDTGVGTILDNGGGLGGVDNDTPALTVSDVSVTEGANTHAVFLVKLSNPATVPVALSLTLADSSATGGGIDFGAGLEVSTDNGLNWTPAANAIIAPGNTSVLVRTPINNDTLDEALETFTLTAARTSGPTSNASATGTVTITDNDAPPQFSIDDVTVNEGAGTMTFTVTLDAPSSLTATVNYALNDSSATAGNDFTAVSGLLTFGPGVTSQTFVVPILNDVTYEGSEAFTVTLSGATNATIADTTGVGTILDDGTGAGGTDNDIPTLTVSSPAVTEGLQTHAVFTVSLSNPSTTPVVVSLALADGTALGAGIDYGAGLEVSTDNGANWSVAANATFAPGKTSILVRTPVINDPLDEPVETFTLTATVTSGPTINGSATATATITDNDPTPALSINNVSVNEDAGTITFTVTLDAASGQSVSVNYATADGTATAGSDYTARSGTLSFAPGVTSQTVTLLVADDILFEQSESFTVALSNAVNASIFAGTGTGTILDDGTGAGGTDNDTPALSVSNVAVTEGVQSQAVFLVSLSHPSTTAVDVSFALADGTALGGGTDYGAPGVGNLQVSTDGGANWSDATAVTFTPGMTSVLVRTLVIDDVLDEATETLTLTATRTAGTTTNLAVTGTAAITDNDPPPSLAISDVTVNEGAGTAAFTVTLSAPSGQPISVDFATGDVTATAGADYGSATGTLTFALGVTSQTITVAILDDAIFENSETFNVTLSGPVNATIADGAGVGTILDNGGGAGGTDNDTPSLGVSSVTVAEGAGAYAVFTVSLSNVSTTDVSVALALANGTATGTGTDFGTAGAGNLQVSTNGGASWADAASATIAAGTTSVLVRTPIVDDPLNEASETFTLTATRIAGTTSNLAAVGAATITDNEILPALTINDLTVNEGSGTATFTVTLGAVSGQTVTVNFASSSGTATAGADFVSTTGSLVFAPGVTTQTITVPILGDSVFEGSESFTILLSAAVNATIADNTGVGTILDDGTGAGGTDDDRPALSIANVSVTEGANLHAVFTVSLSNRSTTDVSIALALAAGTAGGAGVDFGTGGTGNLQVSTDGGANWTDATTATIAAGSTSVLVRTEITDDASNEVPETFTLTATRTFGTTMNGAATGTATITDNDGPPTLSIGDRIVNEATGTAIFTVTLSAPSGQTVTVNYATGDDTAENGSDYTATTGTLTFAPGVTSQTVSVSILDDAVFENSEAFFVLLSGETNASLADDTGVGTILDDGTGTGGTDNDKPSLTVSSPVVIEGTNPHAVFTVTLSNASTTPVDLSLALSSGSATGGGTDFGAADATNLQVSTDGGANWTNAANVTIPAGATSVLVRTPISDDLLDEPVENFTLQATVVAGATLNPSATGTATINDDDATPSLAIGGVTVNEAAGTATFTVTLSAAGGQTVTVNYATSSGTAVSGLDFTGVAGGLTFLPGETSHTISVPILNDTTFEGSESFNVTLSGAVNASISSAVGVGTILDDGTGPGGADNDLPAVTMSNVSVTEDFNPYAVFTLVLSHPATMAISFDLNLSDGTALGGGTDYGTSGAGNLQVSTDGGANWVDATSVTFAPGQTSVQVRTPIASDTLDEAAETLTLTATRTSGPTSNASLVSTATINDDDATPGLSIGDVTVNEAAGTATFTVTLSAPSGQTVSVDYATADATATAGADYLGQTGSLNFAPGVTSQTVTVSILNDAIFENSEAFLVTLGNATHAAISDGTGLGTIRDNGTGPGGADNDTPTLSVTSPVVVEGTNAYAVFSVKLSNPSTTPVSVSLALADGTAEGNGDDYVTSLEVSTDGGINWTPASTATLTPGSVSFLVRTPIVEDLINEVVEDFTLTATVTSGLTTNGAATGTATIMDDDAPPALSINDVTVNEKAGTITFTVSLNVQSDQIVTVNYATANGTATTGSDYTAATGTLTFAPGVTSLTVSVPILDDAVFENSEAFLVVLSGPTNASLADDTGVGTILDDGTGPGGTDNDQPSLTVSSPVVLEGTNLYAVFTVALSNASTTPVDLGLALSSGSATGGGTDFGATDATNLQVSTDGGANWSNAAGVTIPAGAMSVLVRTPISDDLVAEPVENFTLTATVVAGATLNPSAAGTASINDDEAAPSLVIGGVTVNEAAGTATFTVTLSAAGAQTVTVNYATSSGTAVSGLDFTGVAGGLTFLPGETSHTISVPIFNDITFEGSESFNVTLSGAVNATLANAVGVGTILDDGTGPGGADNDLPAVTMSNVSVIEDFNPYAVFTLVLSHPAATAISFDLNLSDGTALGGGTDYGTGGAGNLQVSTDGGANWVDATSVTFAPGQTSVQVRTPIASDTLDEAAETLTLTATRTSGPTSNASLVSTATINDDDATPGLSIGDVTVNEGAGTATFTVTLSAPSGQAVSVDYAMADGTATDGADYISHTGTLTFAPGVTTQTITVSIVNDPIFENSEAFTVTLSNATNAAISDGTGVGTILDDGTGPGGTDNDRPLLTVSDVTTIEGTDAYAQFLVQLSSAATVPVTIALALHNGTATGGGTDFGAADATNLQISTDGGATWSNATSATIPAGTTSVLVRTPVTDDLLAEVVETFTLTATRTSGPTSNATATGTATISDTDPNPGVSIGDVTVNEGAGTATFTVTLSGPSGLDVSVDYATSDGTATDGADYTGTSGTLHFAPGETTRTITVSILNDTLFEQSETFAITLSGAVNATIVGGPSEGTINDDGTGLGGTDNDMPVISVSSPKVTEASDPQAVFTVSLSNLSMTPVKFDLALTNGTAIGAGTDYGAAMEVSLDGGATWVEAGSATIAPGTSSVLVRTPIMNDGLDESAETFTLTATRTEGTTGNASADGIATIFDAASLRGRVFIDANQNGVLDAGDAPLRGVTITLTGRDNLGAAVHRTTTTDSNGNYFFRGLRAGTYTLTEKQPAGVLDGRDLPGSAGGNAVENDVISHIVLGSGENGVRYVFAESPTPPVVPPSAPPIQPFFAYDSFHNFAARPQPSPALPQLSPIDNWRPAMLPLAPIYSGAADPGATLVIELYNANGEHIGSQTVVADAGGNWLANFGTATLRDTPSDVRITQVNAPYSFGSGTGHNLRTYYAPAALNPGHFLSEVQGGGLDDQPAPLLGGLDLANPLQLEAVKYGAELLPSDGVASGN
ncbi:MAG: hypothetical protein QOE70_82 [Chthoniobacter sp.]|jgi:hypothetical protein|nr:hypothetical protein [Chthoniobacter sp.]